MNRVVVRILAVMILVFGSLGLMEAAVRVYSALAFPKMMILDEELGWRHAPNRSKTFVTELGDEIPVSQNGLGQRGPEPREVPIPGTPRILVLGDSFTEAAEVTYEQLFTSQLDVGREAEVLNAGVGGWSTVQEYLYLKNHGLALQPDLVLLMFYENDIGDNCMSHSPGFGPRPHAVKSGSQIDIELDPDEAVFREYILPVPFSTWLNRHSYVYNVVNNRIYQRFKAGELSDMLREEFSLAESCGTDVVNEILGRIHAMLNERGVSFAVALIPEKELLNQPTSPLEVPILQYCDEQAIPCLSLLSSFHEEENREALYFPRDIHWTADGHRAAAQALSPFLAAILGAG